MLLEKEMEVVEKDIALEFNYQWLESCMLISDVNSKKTILQNIINAIDPGEDSQKIKIMKGDFIPLSEFLEEEIQHNNPNVSKMAIQASKMLISGLGEDFD